MIPYPLVFFAVLALTLLSASAAMTIALTVDTTSRPSAALVVHRLMEVTLGTGAIIALLEFG